MPKEILIYESFNRWSSERIVGEIGNIGDQEFNIRINTPGGTVIDGMAILFRISETKSGDTIYVDGQAFSLGAFFLPFFKKRIGHEFSEFMLHKAAYPSWYEASAEEQERLLKLNNMIKKKMIDGGVNLSLIDRVFKPDIREDVYLTAQEALEFGLITEIKKLDVAEKQALQAQYHIEMAAMHNPEEKKEPKKEDNPNTPKHMNIQKLMAEHPDLYAQVKKEGVEAERKRTGQFLGYIKADEKTASGRAIKGLKDGEELMDIQGEMMSLMLAESRSTNMEGENQKDLGEDPELNDPQSTKEKNKSASKSEALHASAMAEVKRRKEGK